MTIKTLMKETPNKIEAVYKEMAKWLKKRINNK